MIEKNNYFDTKRNYIVVHNVSVTFYVTSMTIPRIHLDKRTNIIRNVRTGELRHWHRLRPPRSCIWPLCKMSAVVRGHNAPRSNTSFGINTYNHTFVLYFHPLSGLLHDVGLSYKLIAHCRWISSVHRVIFSGGVTVYVYIREVGRCCNQ